MGSGAGSIPAETQTLTQTPIGAPANGLRAPPPTALPALREEEEQEESQSLQPPPPAQANKRRVPSGDSDDELVDADLDAQPAKRRALDVNGATPAPPERTKFKAASTSPHKALDDVELDKDVEFLKAVASRKRGKKTEDEFDREFNNLRISKPDVDAKREDDEAAWALLADFGDDSGLRGNFMVVVDIDVHATGGFPVSRGIRTKGSRPEWEGRADFKKFKKVFSHPGTYLYS
jgi:hypothetical protein